LQLVNEDKAGDLWGVIFNYVAQAAEKEDKNKDRTTKKDDFVVINTQMDEYLALPLQSRTALTHYTIHTSQNWKVSFWPHPHSKLNFTCHLVNQ